MNRLFLHIVLSILLVFGITGNTIIGAYIANNSLNNTMLIWGADSEEEEQNNNQQQNDLEEEENEKKIVRNFGKLSIVEHAKKTALLTVSYNVLVGFTSKLLQPPKQLN